MRLSEAGGKSSSRLSWPGQEGLDPLLLCVVPFGCPSAIAAVPFLTVEGQAGASSASQHVRGFRPLRLHFARVPWNHKVPHKMVNSTGLWRFSVALKIE